MIRRKVEDDMEEEEEGENECENSDQVGKTSGLGPEDYAGQEDDGVSP